ncbi:Coiled-coil domain-containing protein 57 [Holothuria leucospilota]|uniref:Coiled-coil domain-containing protein 57 n=1 Tax=Holothuria leucospilota TaxID=206669 RepID=A0A9Q1C1P8_HOLLE|nr:Coiled-coil domain-containing protein 57 [Holothuria leucospilota]
MLTLVHQSQTESLQELAAKKEQEWKEIQRLQAERLESTLREKETLLIEEKEKFMKLKDDFKYNLKLLNERDQELERYDATLGQLRAALHSRDAERSDLRIQIDDLKKAVGRNEETQEKLHKQYQQKIKEKHLEIEQYKKAKDEEVEKERGDVESFRMNLQRQVRELEDELDIQRRELSSGFEEAMKRREKEYRTKLEELSAKALSHEMKAKFLAKEVDLVRSSAGQKTDELANCDKTLKNLEKKLKEKEWELCDVTGTKDARIAELEFQVHEKDLKLERLLEEFKRKHSEIDKYAREKETALSAAKDCHTEREHHLEGEIRNLRGQVEALELERRKEDWNHQDVLKERDARIQKLKEDLEASKNHSDNNLTRITQEMINTKRQMEMIQKNEEKLKAELTKRKEDVERYKKDLAQAVSHHAELERSKAQLEVDWQRRYEDAERSQYSRSEELIGKLTKARDEALALVKERDREIEQKGQLLRSVMLSRDQAMATLRQHDIQIPHSLKLGNSSTQSDETAKIVSLQEQNDALKSVIQKMREEMESITAASSHQEKDKMAGSSFPKDYARSMEAEIKQLKAEKRDLTSQVEHLQNKTKTATNMSQDPTDKVAGTLKEHTPHQSALSAQTRAHTNEIAILRHQVMDLEKKLMRTEEIRNQNNHSEMEKRLQADQMRRFDSQRQVQSTKQEVGPSVAAVQAKLKTAIHHISRLARERQQLIELSNRLRSELARCKGSDARIDGEPREKRSNVKEVHVVSPRELAKKVDSQLSAVEQLQYSLTTKELQVMQKKLVKEQEEAEVIQVQLSSSSSTPSSPQEVPSQDNLEPTRETTGSIQPSHLPPQIVENSPSIQSISSESVGQRMTPLMMSSVGEESMRDIWKLLDVPPSPSPVPGSNYDHGRADSVVKFQRLTQEDQEERDRIEVVGSRTELAAKPQSQISLSAKATGRVNQIPVKQTKPKIRNYNIRD